MFHSSPAERTRFLAAHRRIGNYRSCLPVQLACMLMAVLFYPLVAWSGPVLFNPASYASLAKSNSEDTIKPGTRITLDNWKQYKRYLPLGMQALFGGQYRWRVDTSGNFTITVGPTIDFTWPRQYLMDTEKHSGQSRLVKARTGGWAIENYVAGLPFPMPAEPQLSDKIVYNTRYAPSPAVLWWSWSMLLTDRFLNLRTLSGTFLSYRLSHLSTPGMPVNPTYGEGYLNSLRVDLTSPENAKYFTALILQPDNPEMLSEQYYYIPQLRRSLRSSTAGRCAYQGSSDNLNQFQNIDFANFKTRLLGEAKVLGLEHLTSDPAVLYDERSLQAGSSVPGWPVPAMGRWELRKMYIVDSTPLPVLGDFCTSHSVAYIDRDNWTAPVIEDYDADGRLWRVDFNVYMEVPGPAQQGNYMVFHHQQILNLKESHAWTLTMTSPPRIDSEAPAEFRNAADSALPGSMMSINK